MLKSYPVYSMLNILCCIYFPTFFCISDTYGQDAISSCAFQPNPITLSFPTYVALWCISFLWVSKLLSQDTWCASPSGVKPYTNEIEKSIKCVS